MRILYLNPTSCLGGAERVLLSVMGAVRESAPDAELHLLLPNAGPLAAAAEKIGVRVSQVAMPAAVAALGDSQLRNTGRLWKAGSLLLQSAAAAPAALHYISRLRRRVRELAPDVIHSNGVKTHLLGRLANENNTPVLWHIHDFCGRRPTVGRLLRRARRSVVGAVAISQAVAQDLEQVVPGLRVQVVYNTVDADRFTPAPRDGGWLDAAAGLPPAGREVVRIGLIATYARWKGHDLFLEAAACLAAESLREVRFYVIGGPIYSTRGSQYSRDELSGLARARGLESRVGFIDFQEDPVEAFRALDIVVHASTQPEPFGLTIVEAMACAKPVIVARAGGAAELFTHGRDALGFTPGNAEDLAAAMWRLAGDPGLARTLGENARRTVLERFHRCELGPRFLGIYDEIRRGLS
jgi:glycosyltransferase involved in cell wall biosynthesis